MKTKRFAVFANEAGSSPQRFEGFMGAYETLEESMCAVIKLVAKHSMWERGSKWNLNVFDLEEQKTVWEKLSVTPAT